MKWHWRVRIYNRQGEYFHAQIVTLQHLQEIDTIVDFYFNMTGCKMLLEGMSDKPHTDVGTIQEAFVGVWCAPEAFEKKEE